MLYHEVYILSDQMYDSKYTSFKFRLRQINIFKKSSA